MDIVNIIRNVANKYQAVFYLITVLFFIFGLRLLTSPRTARRGNVVSAVGMLIAITITLMYHGILTYKLIIIGLAIGSIIGAISAYALDLRAIPQYVAILNGFGGAVSALVGVSAFIQKELPKNVTSLHFYSAISVDTFIGTLTFWGSMMAFAKLQGLITERPVVISGKNIINLLLLSISAVSGILLVNDPYNIYYLIGILVSASLLAISLTIAVGGADMPVIIALFISYAGLSASAVGFIYLTHGLIMVGSLVGASGLILTRIMAKAMNRDFYGILLGNITPPEMSKLQGGEDIYAGRIKSTTPEEAVMILEASKKVAIVPGYGLAVAQAQGPVRDLMAELEKDGIEVYFAIHPVAGRMPGHMSVLLAEVDVPYDKLKTLEESNELLPDTDVAIVVGANDVVNPTARYAKDSPLYGMPILDVDKCRSVIVIKRSLSPGFSGVPNPLFANDNTVMIFSDAKPALTELVKEYRELRR
ncbi:MAG: NAD(P)(+) transhydrogenase (Re/Si-specific) subunit beta [Nitrospirota bacterium]